MECCLETPVSLSHQHCPHFGLVSYFAVNYNQRLTHWYVLDSTHLLVTTEGMVVRINKG